MQFDERIVNLCLGEESKSSNYDNLFCLSLQYSVRTFFPDKFTFSKSWSDAISILFKISRLLDSFKQGMELHHFKVDLR